MAIARPHGDRRRQQGFTLIEIVSVVIIIGLLVGLVGYNVLTAVDDARISAARTQLNNLSTALDMYRLHNARYPTTDQGLDALVQEPTVPPEPKRYQPGGYIDRLPTDPWGEPYLYRSPGEQNPRSYDLWSYGADGQPGGEGENTDIGNWEEEFGQAG